MNFSSSSAGHEDGVINCPVGDTIKGPASLQIGHINDFREVTSTTLYKIVNDPKCMLELKFYIQIK